MITTAAPPQQSRSSPPARLPLGFTPLHIGVVASGLGLFLILVCILFDATTALLAIGAIVGFVVVGTAIAFPTVALTIMLFSEFANLSGVFEKQVPGSVYLATLGLAVASATVGLCRKRYRDRIRPSWWGPAALYVAYTVSILPAMLFTQAADSTADVLDGALKNLVMLVVVLLLMQMSGRPWLMAGAIVIPLAVLCFVIGVNQYVLDNSSTLMGFSNIQSTLGAAIATPRHAGPLPDSNYWGRFLVLGLPFALTLAHRAAAARNRRRLVLWGLASLMIAFGMYLTQSRGTQLGVVAAVVVWIIATGPRIRRVAMYLTPLPLLALLVPGVGDRLLTLTETLTGPAYVADASLVERTNLQRVAYKIFEENPIFGSGPGTFKDVINQYAPLSSAGSTGGVTATHTLYLEILSETGIVGMAGWIVFIGGTTVLALRALQRLAGAREDGLDGRTTRTYAAAIIASLIGFSVASISLHLTYDRTLLLVCALAGWLYSTTKTDPRLHNPAALVATRRVVNGFRFGVVATLATAIAASVVAATLLLALSRTPYVATTDMTLSPAPGTYQGYTTDVRRRTPILPTYALVIQDGAAQPETTVGADPPRGIMTVRAVGDSPGEATARRDAMVAGARAALDRAGISITYLPVVVSVKGVERTLTLTDGVIRVVLIATILEIVVVVMLCTRIRRQERRQGA